MILLLLSNLHIIIQIACTTGIVFEIAKKATCTERENNNIYFGLFI